MHVEELGVLLLGLKNCTKRNWDRFGCRREIRCSVTGVKKLHE